MGKYKTIESWASSLGYVVESVEGGYVWRPYDETTVGFCASASEVVEAIIGLICSEVPE